MKKKTSEQTKNSTLDYTVAHPLSFNHGTTYNSVPLSTSAGSFLFFNDFSTSTFPFSSPVPLREVCHRSGKKSKPHLTFLFSLMTTFSCAASTHHSPTFSPLITLLSVLQQWLNDECLLSCMCVVCWHVSE
ncbi:hypothetical protein I3843_Q030100 [Carya illinoinensis]|nr:hypothetical protein I3843_Q030100 [Carya illinoinensis]